MTLQDQFRQGMAAMNKRHFFVMVAVLIVGLLVGYTAGRLQAGRYVVHCPEDKDLGFYAMCRYDTYTRRTWICYMHSIPRYWREVPESEGEGAAQAEMNAAKSKAKGTGNLR